MEEHNEAEPLLDVSLSLPTEIMTCVFIDCLPSDGNVRPSTGCAPLLLMWVCQRWKDIALSTRQSWSSLNIECITRRRGYLFRPGTLAGLEIWFSRAHTLPISLKIGCSIKLSQIPADISRLDPLDISTVLPRLERLKITLPEDDWPRFIPTTTLLPQL
ncbi:hypothetical protein C8R45DRAFT_910937, partial [Mycena sanguinolenta]